MIEAAQDLRQLLHGLSPGDLPLSLPGVLSGVTMVFIPSVSTFVISRLLGGGKSLLLGDLIEMQFMGTTYNPWLGSAIALVMMVIVLVCMAIMNRFGEGEEGCRSCETVPAHRQPLLYAAGLFVPLPAHLRAHRVLLQRVQEPVGVVRLHPGLVQGAVPELHDPGRLWVTLAVSILAAVISTIIGTAAAIGFTNFRRRSRTVVTTINNIP